MEPWARRLPSGRAFVCVVVLFLVFGIAYESIKILFSPPQSTHPQVFAKVIETVDVQWEGDSFGKYKKGAEIGQGKNVIQQGLLQIEFFSGSRIIVEGPATFILNNKNGLFLQQGKLSAHVPESGRGFEVATPFVNVVDLGTEFSLTVAEDRADVQVLTGLVKLNQPYAVPVQLFADHAVSINHHGESSPQKVDVASFLSETRFENIVAGYRKKTEGVRSAIDSRLESDPSVIYRLGRKEDPGVHETVFGCRTVAGSLPNKKAFHFNENRDRIELEIAGEYRNLTLLALVKIDQIGRFSNTLFLCESFYEQPGAFCWQIDQNGAPHFHLRDNFGKASVFLGASAIKRTDWDTWCSLAVVIRSADKTIRHFKDGQLIRSLPWEGGESLRIGHATIGNQRIEGKKLTPRWFNGAIEDFVIFSRALSDKEVDELRFLP